MLPSWAVPKGVPEEPGQQRLAVHVEDHPIEYAQFEGEIPAGQYGAGTVEIWDRGTYELVEEKPDGGLTVRLHGERLEGIVDARPGARSTARSRTGCCQEARGRRRRAPRGRRDTAPMLATLTEQLPRRATAGSSRSSGTATARSPTSAAGVELREPQRQGADRALPCRRRRARGGCRRACSTARSARSTSRAARASRRCSRAVGPARLLRLRPARGARRAAARPAARGAARAAAEAAEAEPRRPALGGLRRRRGALRAPPRSRGSRA